MQSTGQTSTQASQPVQLSASTTAISLKNFLRGFGDVVAPGVGIRHLRLRFVLQLHFTFGPDNGKAPVWSPQRKQGIPLLALRVPMKTLACAAGSKPSRRG